VYDAIKVEEIQTLENLDYVVCYQRLIELAKRLELLLERLTRSIPASGATRKIIG